MWGFKRSDAGWSDVQTRVHHIQKKRENIEKRDAGLKALHEKIAAERRQLESERKGIESELLILKDILSEMQKRYHIENPDPLHQGIHREVLGYVSHIEERLGIEARKEEKRVGVLLRSVLDSLDPKK